MRRNFGLKLYQGLRWRVGMAKRKGDGNENRFGSGMVQQMLVTAGLLQGGLRLKGWQMPQHGANL